MITQKIKQHETAIELLQAIDHFNIMKRHTNDSIKGSASYFPELVKKYNHDLIIYTMCISRLENRYNKSINQITK